MKNPFKREIQPAVIYTPFDLSNATNAGRRRFWKQVLPNTTIDYKGQSITFDKKFHVDLANAFHKEAFEQVPVVFADRDNRHTSDPRQFGGDVLDLQVRPDGLHALIEADKEAAKAIKRNPKLGVSARIRQAVKKSDGREFNRAIEHVCLTMNPRVTGMGPWQAVDLSDEDADIEVVDLTAVNYEEGSNMGVRTAKKAASSTDKIDLSALSDEQFQNLLDLAATLTADDADLDELEDEVEEEKPERRKVRRKKSRTKVTVEKDTEADDPEDEDDEDLDDEDETDLSDTMQQFNTMRSTMAQERWSRERGDFLAAGVPAFLLDLAEPVLSRPDAMTIDLSDSETLDATATIRKMLEGVKGVIDLTGELGHQYDPPVDESIRTEADSFLDEWSKQYG